MTIFETKKIQYQPKPLKPKKTNVEKKRKQSAKKNISFESDNKNANETGI